MKVSKEDAISEKTLMESVIEIAEDSGWSVYHTHDSRRSQAGFPDLTLVRSGEIIFAELKSQKGRIKKEQQEWLDRLRENRHVDVYLWRPSDLPGIINRLFGGSNLAQPYKAIRQVNEKLMGHLNGDPLAE